MKTPMRPAFLGPYPGPDVTPDLHKGPGVAPEMIVAPTPGGAASSAGLIQAFRGNPTTGEVGWLPKWKSPHNSRRRSSWRANALTADYRSVGGEGAITFGGTGTPTQTNQNGVSSPFVRMTTENSAVGKSATASTNLGIFRWRWDALIGWWTRAVTFNNCRYYWAATSVSLDQVEPANIGTTLGSGNRAVIWCLDPQTFGEIVWRTITWDGSNLTTTDTGIDAAGSANTVFLPTMEIDTANSQVRYYLFNRDTGQDHGLVHTDAFSSTTTQVFGLEMVVQMTNDTTGNGSGSGLSLDGSEFFCEHEP